MHRKGWTTKKMKGQVNERWIIDISTSAREMWWAVMLTGQFGVVWWDLAEDGDLGGCNTTNRLV